MHQTNCKRKLSQIPQIFISRKKLFGILGYFLVIQVISVGPVREAQPLQVVCSCISSSLSFLGLGFEKFHKESFCRVSRKTIPAGYILNPKSLHPALCAKKYRYDLKEHCKSAFVFKKMRKCTD